MSAIKHPSFRGGEAVSSRAQIQEAKPQQSVGRKTSTVLIAVLVLTASAAQAQYSVTITGGAVTIDRYTGTGGVVAIPATISNLPVTTIGSQAFNGISNVTSVTIPTSVTNLEEQAFDLCSGLTSVTIPGNVTSIGEDAFAECSSLASVVIAAGVASIGVGVFSGCTSLTGITIPASVTNIGLEAFLGCSSVAAFTVNSQNAFYSSTNGVLFNKNQSSLIAAPCEIAGSFSIPSGVTSVGTYAFFDCVNLTNVTVSASVTNIADSAFYYCPILTSVFFAGDAPLVGASVFLSDNDVTAYYLPGATGWSSLFGGIPAVLWNPLIQANGASFGVVGNQFQFNVTGTTNIPIVLETCTNLASGAWTPLQSLILTTGLAHFSEPAQTNSPGSYFRISSP
jgi:hypothetical protein